MFKPQPDHHPLPAAHALAWRPLAAAVLALAAGSAQAVTPSHFYSLDNSLADALGGPALVSQGGTLDASHYNFGVNQGLQLNNAVQADVYTIDLQFSFDTTSGYRRIVDFKAGDSDTGLYQLDTALNFYNVATSAGGLFAAGQPVRVTLSRDAAGQFTGYVNGAQAISFLDSTGMARFDTANQQARFFIDDNAVGGEASAGWVNSIAIYDQALTAQQIATLAPAVPEPASAALLLLGVVGLAGVVRRRAG